MGRWLPHWSDNAPGTSASEAQIFGQLFLGMLPLSIMSPDMASLPIVLPFIALFFICEWDSFDDPCIFIMAAQLRFFIIAGCDIAWHRFIAAACDWLICAEAEEPVANATASTPTANLYFVISFS